MNNDADLLRRYVEEGSEAAFAEIVNRHVGLVFGTALRRVGYDSHLAEDVTQRVFTDLARKAPALTEHPALSGWLHASAHCASASMVRSERRRKAREIEASAMETTSIHQRPENASVDLSPAIDELFVALKERDREALALRFFEGRSFADVGAVLRVTEDAARKRVDRALQKLRAMLARRGVSSTSAALGLVLASVAETSAPSGLGATIASRAMAHAALPTTASTMLNLASTAWPTAAALVIGGWFITSQWRANEDMRDELRRLTAARGSVAALHAENERLTRDIEIADTSDAWAPALPVTRVGAVDRNPARTRVTARVSVSPEGGLAWNGEAVTLREFLARLETLQATSPAHSSIIIRAGGAEFPALAYVIDEVRKAQINHVAVQSDAMPDPAVPVPWFQSVP